MPVEGSFDRERAHEMIAALVQAENPTAILTKFVVIAEVIDDEDKHIYAFTSPDQRAWETLGLLQFGDALERTYIALGEQGD